MGQYFIPTFLDHAGRITRAVHPRDYGSGDKLGGHTREGTPFLAAVETLLALDGGSRLVWAGDYAANEPGRDANLYGLIEPHQFVRFEGLIDPEEDIEPNTPRPPVQLGFHTFTCATPIAARTSTSSPCPSTTMAGHSNQNAELAAMTLAGSVLQVVCGVADGSVVYGHLGIE